MISNFKFIVGFAALLAAAAGFGFGASASAQVVEQSSDSSAGANAAPRLGAPPIPGAGGEVGFAPPAMPDFGADIQSIDAAEFEALAAVTERIDRYLVVDEDGTVRLPDAVTAEMLDVDPVFLADFRAALGYSNQLIERGEIIVNPDLTVEAGENLDLAPIGMQPEPGLPGAALDGAGGGVAVDGAEPDWHAYGYPSGAMFYNSYGTYHRYSRSYYALCSSMAAYLGYPHISTSLVYFYTYSSSYLSSACYNPYGLYYFLPYTSGCSGYYSPCFGSFGSKVGYLWTHSYAYDPSCRCTGSTWSWRGYWMRY